MPQRAFLQKGVTNFVTRTGMNQLLTEKESLINEKAGDKIILKREREDIVYEIMDISYR